MSGFFVPTNYNEFKAESDYQGQTREIIKVKKIASILTVSLFLLAGCDSGQVTKANPVVSEKPQPEKKSYVLTERENVVLRNLLVDETLVAADGGDISEGLTNKLYGDYVVTTSDKLQKAYERNEVAGDQAFRNKIIFVNGIVKSIDRSIGENYFIGLKGGSNPFMQPKASMADGYTNFLASLEKGNKVVLSCKGNGMLMGSAMLSNCEPIIDYASKAAAKFANKLNIGNLLAKHESSDINVMAIVIVSVAATDILSGDSKCLSAKDYDKKCIADLRKLMNSKDKQKEAAFTAAMSSAVEKMGIDKDVFKQLASK